MASLFYCFAALIGLLLAAVIYAIGFAAGKRAGRPIILHPDQDISG